MLAGNHDAWGEGGTGLSPFWDVAKIIEKPCVIRLSDGTELRCLPWDAEPETLSGSPDLPLIAHAFLKGSVLGPDDSRNLAKGVDVSRYGDFPVAFFGDIHKGQWLERVTPGCGWVPYQGVGPIRGARLDGSTSWAGEIFYPGSPYMQNWGERNDGPKGVLLADLETGSVVLHELKAPRFVHVEGNDKTLKQWLPQIEELTGDFVRIVYTGSDSKVLDAWRAKADLFRSFEVITRRKVVTEKRAEIHAGMDRSEMVDQYMLALPPQCDPKKARTAMRQIFVGA
jgi:hypothetical protein